MFFFVLLFFPILTYSIKVAFNGASVTAQKSGYVEETQKYFPDWKVVKFGYGATYISLCLIERILKEKPDLVFLDWSLHPCGSNEKDIIKSLVWKLQQINAIPVFIHMPRIDGIKHSIVETINELSIELNFLVIDLAKLFTYTELKEKYLRDNCHTNKNGAIAYAEKIFNFIKENDLKIPQKFSISPYYAQQIKFLPLEKTIYKCLDFQLNGSIIGFHGKVGPYSNYLDLKINDIPKDRVRLWDRWCYYERNHFITQNVNVTELSRISYKVLHLNFYRPVYNRNITWDWNEFVSKFEISEICYTGDIYNIKIDDVNIEN